MTPRFSGKTAVVTGGASGIGEAFCRRLAAEGARVLIADVDEEAGRALAQELGDAALFHRTDVASPEDCAAAVSQAAQHFGGPDLLVNSAGIGEGAPVAELEESLWDQVLDVNLKGVFLMSRATLPSMVERGGGVILNLASLAGLVAAPGMGAYGTSKAGVIHFTRVLALENARHGIRANALCPVWTDTPMLRRHLDATGKPERALRGMTASVPLGRLATVDDVTAAGLFLASDEAAFITGVALPIDGGTLCR